MATATESIPPLLIPVREVAHLLGVSVTKVWRMNSAGLLPAPIRLGHLVRWRAAEIRAWTDAGGPARPEWEAGRSPHRRGRQDGRT